MRPNLRHPDSTTAALGARRLHAVQQLFHVPRVGEEAPRARPRSAFPMQRVRSAPAFPKPDPATLEGLVIAPTVVQTLTIDDETGVAHETTERVLPAAGRPPTATGRKTRTFTLAPGVESR